MSQYSIVVPLAWRIATPKLSPVTVIASSRTATSGAVTFNRALHRKPGERRPGAGDLPHSPIGPGPAGAAGDLARAPSAATPPGGRCWWRPGNHTHDGLAAQSVCRVTGPLATLAPPEGDGWADGVRAPLVGVS